MTRVEVLHLLPYLLSLALSVGITVYAWRHRQVQGAKAYTVMNSLLSLVVFGFILELLNPGLDGKLFWDKVQWAGDAAAMLAILNFAVYYTGHQFKRPWLVWGVVSVIPVILTISVLIKPLEGLVYHNPHLDNTVVFGELQYGFTWLDVAFAINSYLACLIGFALLARKLARTERRYRAQVITVIVGIFIPIAGTALPLLGIRITDLRDPAPITSAIGNLVVAWGVFRYHWLDIVRIARDEVLESMDDLVFVLDAQDCIVDVNPSAQRFLDLAPSQIIGMPAAALFKDWQDMLEKSLSPAKTSFEVVVGRNGRTTHLDFISTLLYAHSGEYEGRIFVARDVTAYTNLQSQLQDLNKDLESRVQERTEQLEEAYNTTLEGWAKALELRDKETEGHSRRVVDLTVRLARALGLGDDELIHIHRGAILHDIGKMSIPDEILRKTSQLTEQDWVIIRKHPVIAYELLSKIPFLKDALDIPYCHHEKWDGSGYPLGLKGEEIPLAARIFSVVDVWDAVQSDRTYKRGWSRQRTIAYLKEQSGRHLDPLIVHAFLQLAEQGQV